MKVISVDIGATSGRVMIVKYEDNIISYEEMHRFDNKTYLKDDFLYWDFNLLINNIIDGIKKSLNKYDDIKSIGIDTWGVDYGVIDTHGNLIGDPICYRDTHTYSKQKEVLNIIPFEELYSHVGIQNMHFNTIYQLYKDERLKDGNTILMIPDLIAYYLTNEKRLELTNASTTSLYNFKKKEIDKEILQKLNIPYSIFPKMIYPKDVYGELKKEIYPDNYKGNKIEVIAVCSHDTASSVLGMDGFNNFAYLSSGTWSLIGVELDKPLYNKESIKANFTNEIGYDFSIRYLKNTMGMFLINETRNDFKNKGIDIPINKIKDYVLEAYDIPSYLDTNDPLFETPGDMINKINYYLIKTNQVLPQNEKEYLRLIYKSMALSYKNLIIKLERLIGYQITSLLIGGGGNQASILNQFTANALNIEVKTGPIESTIIGNGICQFLHYGVFKNVEEARKVIEKSIDTQIFKPCTSEAWENEYQNFLKVTKIGG